MKNFIFGLMATVFASAVSFGQTNNPYDKKGKDYVQSLLILEKDYKDGKIKNADQQTLDYYAKILPLKCAPNADVAAQVIRATQNETAQQVLNRLGLSDYSKQVLLNSVLPKANIEALVEQTKKQSMSEKERELVLTSLAITYNLARGPRHSSVECTVNGETGPGACTAVGALVGLSVGSAICGPLCGAVGALVGGIIGSAKE